MKLHHRLAKLERLQPPPSCIGCGYPAKAKLRVMFTKVRGPLPTCPVCQRPLDDEGRPLHTPYTRISIGERTFNRTPGRIPRNLDLSGRGGAPYSARGHDFE